MDMTHDEKVAYLRDLGQRGIRPSKIAPPMYRRLWRLGVQARPPHFASFWWLAAANGLVFGVLLGGTNWIMQRWVSGPQQGPDVTLALATGVFAGAIFGVYV